MSKWKKGQRKKSWISYPHLRTCPLGTLLASTYRHSIYTVSTQYLHSIDIVSTQYLHSIDTVSTQYLHSIDTVSTQYRHSIDTVSTQYRHSIFTVSTQYLHSNNTPTILSSHTHGGLYQSCHKHPAYSLQLCTHTVSHTHKPSLLN